jgi:hypothetical protein
MIAGAFLIVLVLATWAVRNAFEFDWPTSTICGMAVTMATYIGYFTWVLSHLPDAS